MRPFNFAELRCVLLVALLATSSCMKNSTENSAMTITPSRMQRVGMVDERYQSYNVEMLEVTGGRFWRPYSAEFEALLKQPVPAAKSSTGDTPAGMNPELYEYRPPLDLTNSRLRKLAAALGPTYVRVSGTWANTTYLPETDNLPAKAPARLRGRADSRSVERISRLCECRGWPYCDLFRHTVSGRATHKVFGPATRRSCAVRATRTWGAYWRVPVGYGRAPGRLKGSKQDLSSGFRRRDDQRTGEPTACSPTVHSGLLICDHRTGRRSWNEPSRQGQARRA